MKPTTHVGDPPAEPANAVSPAAHTVLRAFRKAGRIARRVRQEGVGAFRGLRSRQRQSQIGRKTMFRATQFRKRSLL